MLPNNDRYDLSNRLIHFFRRVDISGDDAPPWPQHLNYASIDEGEELLEPLFLLRHAIRGGRL
jgi:hypothetical protein